ncbi:hypothetical protein E2P84_19610 [Burkholderia cepacia]|uniref:Uncharacterized protein n=2 Tax=Burkholderia cepacia TaxID=292 RepID=A0AAX2RN77_BURCE|nr:hypothetical protein [Burkholderia cepacia]TES74118.1 hypothetical protein E2P84_19610 [Burkholderia cepacia]TES99864.1 hypothetical protein E3D36_23240 [Burkholderia cepacia]TEU34376.1 hypothetical protein E3D38_43445 [Burkholderia cepacia]TEU36301.1 hypothetical protein E3D39_27480 [Burkholderia cepacia]TEU43189.1 hypothetical protein E3D37_24000 [Burkholderia cepacia]
MKVSGLSLLPAFRFSEREPTEQACVQTLHAILIFVAYFKTTLMIDSLVSAVGAANTTFEFLKNALSARDEAKVGARTAELETKLREINQAALMATQEALKAAQDMRAMDQKLAALERENEQLKARAERRGQYVLTDIGGGALAYRYSHVEGSADAPHYLCQPCMSKGNEIALQPYGRHGNYRCPSCETVYITDGKEPRATIAVF